MWIQLRLFLHLNTSFTLISWDSRGHSRYRVVIITFVSDQWAQLWVPHPWPCLHVEATRWWHRWLQMRIRSCMLMVCSKCLQFMHCKAFLYFTNQVELSQDVVLHALRLWCLHVCQWNLWPALLRNLLLHERICKRLTLVRYWTTDQMRIGRLQCLLWWVPWV